MMMMINDRRITRARMTFALVQQILRGEAAQVPLETNAPKDLEVLAIESPLELQINKQCYIYLRSSEFDVVPEDELPPELPAFWYKTPQSNEPDAAIVKDASK